MEVSELLGVSDQLFSESDNLGDKSTNEENLTSQDVSSVVPLDENVLLHNVILDNDAKKLLRDLASKRKYWEGKTILDVRSILNSPQKIQNLTVKDLDIILSFFTVNAEQKGIKIRRNSLKYEKVNAIFEIMDMSSRMEHKTKRRVPTLLSIAEKVVKSLPKVFTNAVYASVTYKQKYQKWVSEMPFAETMEIEGCDSNQRQWFSYPERNKYNGRLLSKVVDGDHLLVNCRVKICKDGIHNISKEGWHEVARQNPHIISPSLVEDLLDKQKNSFAQKTFSVEVQSALQKLGYSECAEFCRLIRNWYRAEDDRAIPAVDRCHMRLEFKDFLMKDIDFSTFPPYGSHIKGMPQTMMEGFLSSIDTHLQVNTVQYYTYSMYL